MTSLAISNSFSATPTSLLVNEVNTYTFSLIFYGNPSVGDYLLLTFPAGMTVSGSSVCTPISGVAAVDCSSSNSTHLLVILVAVPASSISISFSASNIKNYQISGS